MLLDERTMEALRHIASLRGINLGEHRCAQVYRELERKGQMTDSQIFDRFRELGASISFSQERGLIEALNEMERRRQARFAEAHRQMLEADRQRRQWEREADREYEAKMARYRNTKNTGKRYTGKELQQLLARDSDAKGKMRGPVIGVVGGLTREGTL